MSVGVYKKIPLYNLHLYFGKHGVYIHMHISLSSCFYFIFLHDLLLGFFVLSLFKHYFSKAIFKSGVPAILPTEKYCLDLMVFQLCEHFNT